jgi:hypothetical protein
MFRVESAFIGDGMLLRIDRCVNGSVVTFDTVCLIPFVSCVLSFRLSLRLFYVFLLFLISTSRHKTTNFLSLTEQQPPPQPPSPAVVAVATSAAVAVAAAAARRPKHEKRKQKNVNNTTKTRTNVKHDEKV